MSAPFRFPRFFVTTPSPCPYIAGKTERKVFTELSGAHAGELNDALGRIGFRRSQNVAYRPSCIDCAACYSSCTVVTLSRKYLGPMALHRALTLIVDPRDQQAVDAAFATMLRTPRTLVASARALARYLRERNPWEWWCLAEPRARRLRTGRSA